MSKILRRQKIYAEANFSLKSIDNSQDCDVTLANAPVIVKDVFFSYSDLYIKHQKVLYSCEVRLSNFIQTNNCVLIGNSSSFVTRSLDFVPFYKNYSPLPPVGVLLDLPKPKMVFNSIINKSNDISEKFFSLCTAVNSHYIYSYPKKQYASYYCRNSCSEIKKRRATLDLDEIVPVVEEVVPQNVENRRISSARYATEGDILILDPLLLEVMPRTKRFKNQLTESEHNKIARITITYILAFFALVLTTFFIIYLA